MKKIEKWIDEALKEEIDFQLDKDFKNKVVKSIKKREENAQLKIYFWMTLGILSMVTSGHALMIKFFPDLIQKIMDQGVKFNHLIPMAVFVGVVIVLIQYLDKKLIKNRFIVP